MDAVVWILVAASALALQIVTVVMRREHKSELPYLGLLVADLGVLVFVAATHQESSLAGKVAASLAAVMVLAPRLCDRLERGAFAREDLSGALRAAKLRELVVPGLGSTRRRRQIANLIEARDGGVAQVLRRLDEELGRTRNGDEITTLVVERSTALFMAGRFSECIDAAAKLGSAWPSEHPVLGVYLVRAHAALGELAEAIAVLEAVDLQTRRVAIRAHAGPADPGAADAARLRRSSSPTSTTCSPASAPLDVDLRASEFLHDTAARSHCGVAGRRDRAALDGVASRAAPRSARPARAQRQRRGARLRRARWCATGLVAILVQHGHLRVDPDSYRAHPLGRAATASGDQRPASGGTC